MAPLHVATITVQRELPSFQTLYLLSLIIEVCVVDHAVLSLPVPGCDGVGGGSGP